MNETISADRDYSGSPWDSLVYYGQENSSLDKSSEASDEPSDQSETMEELDDDSLTLSYITGQIENPTKADRDRIAKVDLAKVRAEGSFEQRLNAITRSHLEVFLANQIESKARADEILENISDDELMSAYESLDHGGADSIDDYIQFMAEKMDIPFRDQIRLVEDETLDDALGAVWDDDSFTISVKSLGDFMETPTSEKMRTLSHELLHAKQYDTMTKLFQTIADEYPEAEFGTVEDVPGKNISTADNFFLRAKALELYDAGALDDNKDFKRGAEYAINKLSYFMTNEWRVGEMDGKRIQYNPNNSQVVENEAYTFDTMLFNRVDNLRGPSVLETNTPPVSQERIAKVKHDALMRLFSPTDMLKIDDIINDGDENFGALNSIICRLTETPILQSTAVTIDEKLASADCICDRHASCIRIHTPSEEAMRDSAFRRKYFEEVFRYAVEYRATEVNNCLERNANHLNVASENFIVPFINHFASLVEEAPSRSRDMFILGIDARANPDTYKNDDYFSQFDEMTKHAKRNPRTNIAFKLQKRRDKKQLKQHS